MRKLLAALLMLSVFCLAKPPTQGLIGHWKFDEGYGFRSMDASNSRTPAMLFSAQWVEGQFGRAVKLTGDNSYIRIPALPQLKETDAMSLGVWVTWEGTGKYPNILSWGWNPGGLLIFVADDNCCVRLGRPHEIAYQPGSKWCEGTAGMLNKLPRKTWVHLAFTYQKPTLTTYVNGKKAGSANWPHGIATSGDIFLGKWYGKNSHNGLLDDLQIYDCALDATQIQNLYNDTKHTMADYTPSSVADKTPVILNLKTKYTELTLAENACLTSLKQLAPQRQLLSGMLPFFEVTLNNDQKIIPQDVKRLPDGNLIFGFGNDHDFITIQPMANDDYVKFTLLSCTIQDARNIAFACLQPALNQYLGHMAGLVSDDASGICLRSLNRAIDVRIAPYMRAAVNVKYLPQKPSVAIAAGPRSQLIPMLQAMATREDVPKSIHGGPYAMQSEWVRGSYLFASPSPLTLDAWLELADRGGFTNYHINEGWETTLGSYIPKNTYYPNGIADMKAMVDKIKAAGLRPGIHTLTGCINPRDPLVSPKPSHDLITKWEYTLAKPFKKGDTTLYVNEKPRQGHELIWSYSCNGNAFLIGDEIIRYTAISYEPPYAFLNCERGAFKTVQQDHPAGASAGYLLQRYIAFYPQPDSPLADTVADAIAKVYNTLDLNELYFDGSEGMGSTYAIDAMRWKIFQRLKHNGVHEGSCYGHNNWWFHSRLGTWDHPVWGMKPFHDEHIARASLYRLTDFLPPQLGWWAPRAATGAARGHFLDETEYFAVKNLAIDGAMSIQGVSPGSPANANDHLTILGWYERLRLARYFTQDTLGRLAKPGEDFRLRINDNGDWQLTPVDIKVQRAAVFTDNARAWQVANPYARQPLRTRIEALYTAVDFTAPQAHLLADFSEPDGISERKTAAPAITQTIDFVNADQPDGRKLLHLTAHNKGCEPNGAWTSFGRTYPHPYYSMQPGQAIGLRVKGDGSGALLNIQLLTPSQYHGTVADHYVRLDFTGWRDILLLLRERDSADFANHVWPYRSYGGSHAIYRNAVDTAHLSGINVFLNDIPKDGTVDILMAPLLALPIHKQTLSKLTLDVNGTPLALPFALESGEYMTLEDNLACHYSEQGPLLARQRLTAVPELLNGANRLRFTATAPHSRLPRAEITTFALGTPFGQRNPDADASYLKRIYAMPHVITSLQPVDTQWQLAADAPSQLHVDITLNELKTDANDYASGTATLLDATNAPDAYKRTPQNNYAKYAFDSEDSGTAKKGVTFAVKPLAGHSKDTRSIRFSATSSRADNSGWAAIGRRFDQPLDISSAQTLGFWLKGDGHGEYFKVQLRDVKGLWHDMVTHVNFNGWKYIEFSLTNVKLDLSKLEYILYYYNNIAAGDTVNCQFDSVKVMKSQATLRQPVLTVNGQNVPFDCRLAIGDTIRCRDARNWSCLAANGTVKASGTLPQPLPQLKRGLNSLVFSGQAENIGKLRVTVNAISQK